MSAKRLKLKSSRKLLQDYKANKWKTWDFESGFADTNTMPCCLSSKNGFSILMPFTPCLSVLTSKMYVHLFLAMTLIGPSRLLSPYSGAFFFFFTSAENFPSTHLLSLNVNFQISFLYEPFISLISFVAVLIKSYIVLDNVGIKFYTSPMHNLQNAFWEWPRFLSPQI